MVIEDKIVEQHGLVVAAVYAIITANPMITHAEIATYCHISVSSVKRALEELQRLNYIKVKNNKPQPNTYEILYSPRINRSPEKSKGRGIFGMVKLSDNDYAMLLNDYPKSVVEYYIQRLDSYLKNNPKKSYESHSATIVSWIIEDDTKRQNTKNYKSLSQIKKEEERADRYLSLVNNFSFKPPEITTDDEIVKIYDLKSSNKPLTVINITINAKKMGLSIHDYMLQLHKPNIDYEHPELTVEQCNQSSFEITHLFNYPIAPNEIMSLQEKWRNYYKFINHVKEALENASEECKARIFSRN